jgi:formylmethanofuran dehydrogenase subunit E
MDAYDLFLKDEYDRDARLEARPECVCCGEHIQDDYQFIINGESYCEECMMDQFRRRIPED